MKYHHPKQQSGFTLIELVVSIGILGALMGLSIRSYSLYAAQAGYASAELTLRQAITAMEAAMTSPDRIYSSFTYSQNNAGGIADPVAGEFLPEFQLPKSTSIEVAYDNGCADPSCQLQTVTVRHCRGITYVSWVRFGDGFELMLEDIPGTGC